MKRTPPRSPWLLLYCTSCCSPSRSLAGYAEGRCLHLDKPTQGRRTDSKPLTKKEAVPRSSADRPPAPVCIGYTWSNTHALAGAVPLMRYTHMGRYVPLSYALDSWIRLSQAADTGSSLLVLHAPRP